MPETSPADETNSPSEEIEPVLPASGEMLRQILEFAPDAILVVGGNGRIIRVNEQVERFFQYDRSELLNQPVEMLIPEKSRKRHVADRDSYIASPHTRSMGSGGNFRGRRKDGTTFPVDVMLSPMGDGKERITIAIVRDVTEQQKLEDAIMYVSEKERQHIGLEIHDDLCQSLVAVTLLSNALHESLVSKRLAEQKDAKDVVEMLKGVNSQARSLARGLTAMNLTGDGFSRAVEEFANRIGKQSKLECRVECQGLVEFSNNSVATHVYRIIQQAVNNAVMHAKAKCITIRVMPAEGAIVSVEDDGIGIPDPLPVKDGIGFKIMQHRARSIGATVKIRRREQGGTEVVCSLPGKI